MAPNGFVNSWIIIVFTVSYRFDFLLINILEMCFWDSNAIKKMKFVFLNRKKNVVVPLKWFYLNNWPVWFWLYLTLIGHIALEHLQANILQQVSRSYFLCHLN